jgi:hypothetical protein
VQRFRAQKRCGIIRPGHPANNRAAGQRTGDAASCALNACQPFVPFGTGWEPATYSPDRSPPLHGRHTRGQHHARVRALPHIKKLDDCFGQFLVRIVCGPCREIEPEALARLVGWKMTLKALAPPLRCSQCGKKAAEIVAVARPRPRGVPRNPH